MLRNGVNYKGLYGNLRMCFGVESKGHELNKNCLPCLLDLLPVFVRHILAILVRFQWALKVDDEKSKDYCKADTT